MKQELLQCFLSRYILTNRVSLYGTYVMMEKNQNKKGSCFIPLAIWASIKHSCDALPFWLSQPVNSQGLLNMLPVCQSFSITLEA